MPRRSDPPPARSGRGRRAIALGWALPRACLWALLASGSSAQPIPQATSQALTEPTSPLAGHGMDRGWSLSASVLRGRYLAREPLGDASLNEDRGTLAGGQLALAVVGSRARLQLSSQWLDGSLAYRGYTQLLMPLDTRTQLAWRNLMLQAAPATGWPLNTGPGDGSRLGTWGLSTGLGQMRLRRAIQAGARSLATTETLTLQVLQAGAHAWLSLPLDTRLHLALQWQHAHHLRLAVNTLGVLDDYQLSPRSGGWPRAEVALQQALGQGLSWQLTWQHERLRVQPAPAQAVFRGGRLAAISSYPGSRQRLGSLGLGLQARF